MRNDYVDKEVLRRRESWDRVARYCEFLKFHTPLVQSPDLGLVWGLAGDERWNYIRRGYAASLHDVIMNIYTGYIYTSIYS